MCVVWLCLCARFAFSLCFFLSTEFIIADLNLSITSCIALISTLPENNGEWQAEFHRQQAEKERAIERAAMIAAGANPDDAAAAEHSIELQQGSGGPRAASCASSAEPQPLLMPVVSGVDHRHCDEAK